MEEKKIRSGFVALIGRSNVGKSTLMNHLIGQKIAITADKPQTTRQRILTVYTDERGQIVFLDTPGLHTAKNKLGEYMVDQALGTLKQADVIMWLVEPGKYIGAGDRSILEILKQAKKPVVLVINKADKVDKGLINDCMRLYSREFSFLDIVPVSALKGVNLDELMRVLFNALPYGPMYYDEDTITDQPMRQIAAEIIREKALRYLNEEVPHGIAVNVERMSERPDGTFDIDADIVCEKDSHKGIIIGKNGATLKRIGTSARLDIEKMTGSKVNLKLWVKVRRQWRNNELYIKSYGYKD